MIEKLISLPVSFCSRLLLSSPCLKIDVLRCVCLCTHVLVCVYGQNGGVLLGGLLYT